MSFPWAGGVLSRVTFLLKKSDEAFAGEQPAGPGLRPTKAPDIAA